MPRAAKIGGLPSRPKKAAILTMRVTQTTKDALDAAAVAEGRSLAEVTERLLDDALQGRASLADRLGQGPVADALLAMAAFAHRVRAEVGDPASDMVAKTVLQDGWVALALRSLPFTPATEDGVAVHLAMTDVAATAEAFASEIMAGDGSGASWAMHTQVAARVTGLLWTRTRPLAFALTDLTNASALSDEAIGSIVAALASAPPEVQALNPSPETLRKALTVYLEKRRRYAVVRDEARAKAERLLKQVSLAG